MKISIDAPELVDALNFLGTSLKTLASVMREEEVLAVEGEQEAKPTPKAAPKKTSAPKPEPADARQPLTSEEEAEVRKKTSAFFAAAPENKKVVQSWLDEHGYERVTMMDKRDMPGFLQLIAG